MCPKQCLIFPDASFGLFYYFYLQYPVKKRERLVYTRSSSNFMQDFGH